MTSRGCDGSFKLATGQLDSMKDQTNKEPLESLPGKLPVTAGRSGTASAQHVEKQGAAPVDPDGIF